jgi:hypothetical protein
VSLSMTVPTRSVGDDGVARLVAVVSRDGVEIGTATWSLTPDLRCEFGWQKAEGAPGLDFLTGWEK